MSRRMKSVEVMKCLQAFTQGGIISPIAAGAMVDGYVNGDDGPLRDLIINPDIPVAYTGVLTRLQAVIQ